MNIQSDLDALHRWLQDTLSSGAIAVLTHKNGDADTIGSALALSRSLGQQAKACGLHISKVAQKILGQCDDVDFQMMNASSVAWPRTLSGIVVVDCAAPSQLGFELPNDIPICVIDHHFGGVDWDSSALHIQWDTCSTAEIIFSYLQSYRPNSLDVDNCKLLLGGIITDTGRFRHADFRALTTAGSLAEISGIDYHSFVENLESTVLNNSQKMAIAKALSRVEAIDAGDWYLIHTKSSTNEGIVSRSLMTAGADVALVVRRAKDETRLISRASKKAICDGMHLGKMMEHLSQRLGGEGGGHAGAAGWSGDVPPITAVSAFISDLSAYVRLVE